MGALLMIEAKFTIAMGPYQNLKVRIEAADPYALSLELEQFSDKVKAQLGVFHAELESWAAKAREDALNGVTEVAVENLSALGATVVSEAPVALPEEPEQEQPVRPWDRKPVAQPKAWESKPKEEPKDDWNW